jgi:hypothetical protein
MSLMWRCRCGVLAKLDPHHPVGLLWRFCPLCLVCEVGRRNQVAEWRTIIQDPGYYEVMAYINPMTARMGIRMGGQAPGSGGPGGGMPEIPMNTLYDRS